MPQGLHGLIPFLKSAEIQKIIKNLAAHLERDYAKQELILICPLRGSVFLLSDLVHQLSMPIQIDFVCIESTGGDGFRLKQDISLDLRQQHVLIVEEIIDSGLVLSFLKKRIQLCHPASCKSLVLLDNSSRRQAFVHADYVGQVIDDRFIVGYGMGMDEAGRGLPDIYHLEQ